MPKVDPSEVAVAWDWVLLPYSGVSAALLLTQYCAGDKIENNEMG